MKKEQLKELDRVITTLVKCAEQVKDLINEPEKYTPKMGDFIYNEWSDECYIDIYKNEKDFFASFSISIKSIALTPSITPYSSCSNIRPATEEEKQLLLKALHEKSKDWDFEKMEIIDYRWRASTYEKYFYYDTDFDETSYSYESWYEADNRRFNSGNYFKTKEEAEEYRQYCLAYKKLNLSTFRGEIQEI